jgi:hypothetical protein
MGRKESSVVYCETKFVAGLDDWDENELKQKGLSGFSCGRVFAWKQPERRNVVVPDSNIGGFCFKQT